MKPTLPEQSNCDGGTVACAVVVVTGTVTQDVPEQTH